MAAARGTGHRVPQGSLGSEGREDVGRGRGRHRLSARQSGDGKGARVPSACAEADGETGRESDSRCIWQEFYLELRELYPSQHFTEFIE